MKSPLTPPNALRLSRARVLDDVDGVRRPGCAQRREVQQGRSEVLVPMGEEVEELVQPGNDGRRHEGPVQQSVRLIGGGSGSVVVAVARYVQFGSCCGDHNEVSLGEQVRARLHGAAILAFMKLGSSRRERFALGTSPPAQYTVSFPDTRV